MNKWWQEAVVYQIYPRSFKDSNGDGFGDLPGIIEKLPILKDLGVDVIWLSPVYTSPDKDNGYDIEDYYNIDPKYGTMKDMDKLLKVAKKLELRIVMDLVINHTSDRHDWFKKSVERIDPYTDYYIWKDKEELNNWTGFFADKVWEYEPIRKQYYLHLFAKEQPDLNYYNPAVIKEVKDIMRFWLDKGVSGFRCDVINIIYKTSLSDGKKQLALTGIEHYLSQEGTVKILQEIRRDVLSQYDCFTVGETVFVTPKAALQLTDQALDMVFSFEHLEADQMYVKWISKPFNLKKFANIISKWQTEVPWNAIYLENHDQPRSVTRYGEDEKYQQETAKMLGMLLFTLRGTPFLYQGEEIGIRDARFNSMLDIKDVESHNVYALMRSMRIPANLAWKMILKKSRDHGRTVIPWDASGGFSETTPWLNYAQNPQELNYEDNLKRPDSVWKFYQELIQLRKNTPALIFGEYYEILVTKQIYAYKRILEGEEYLIILNFSNKFVNLKDTIYLNKYKIILANYKLEIRNFLWPFGGMILKKEVKK